MKDNWEQSMAYVFREEGGFSNHSRDPGGMTNLGVTKVVWEDWTGRDATEEDMRNLKPDDVMPLYKKKYWDACQCDSLHPGVDFAVFDYAVNSGPRQSIKTLQYAINATVDGIIGPQTIRLEKAADPKTTINRICDKRLAFLRDLPTYDTFGRGWESRVARVRQDAIAMIG